MKRTFLAMIGCLFLASTLQISTAQAATTYKVKGTSLYNAKTMKLSKGTVVYKNKLYKNGKLYKKETVFQQKLYKNGVRIKDTGKPVITLSSSKTKYTIQNGKKFTLPTATAKDRVSGKVKVTKEILNEQKKKFSKLDTTEEGTYTIMYSAKDLEGNVAKKQIEVVVLESENFDITEIR